MKKPSITPPETQVSPAALDFNAAPRQWPSSEDVPAAPLSPDTLRAMNAARAAERMAHVQDARQKGELPPSPAGPDASPAPHIEPLQFITAAQIKKLPPVAWRVKNVFPAQGVAAIYGPPASGKSFLSLDLAAAIASGRDWFGHKCAAAPVFYVYLEGSGALKNRIAAWEQEREKPFPDAVVFFLGAFNLLENMDSLVAAIPHGAVVIVDTLAAAAPGFDENSGADMGRAIEALGRVAREKNGLALVVHHSGKDASRGLRGHSSLLGALDTVVSVDRAGLSTTRQWTLVKSKDAEDGLTCQFTLHRVELGIDEDGYTVTSCIVRRLEVEQRSASPRMSRSMKYGLASLVEALAEEESERVHVEKWREIFYRGHWADNLKAKQMAFQRARAYLVEVGLARVTDDEYFLTSQGEGNNGTKTEQIETGGEGNKGNKRQQIGNMLPTAYQRGEATKATTPYRGVAFVAPVALDTEGGKTTDPEQTVCCPASRKAEK